MPYPGVNVIITIFGVFRKKIGVFLKSIFIIQFLPKLAVIWAKTPIISPNFSAKIFSKSWTPGLKFWARL
jgi:hypothetical protein